MAETPIAIVAGDGALPRLLAEACVRSGRRYGVVRFAGVVLEWADGHPVIDAVYERPGALFSALRRQGLGAAVFAGGMRRPEISPWRLDFLGLRIAPRILGALKSGDDTGLRAIATVFESQGIEIVPAEALLDGLRALEGTLTTRWPSPEDAADATRGREILDAVAPVDVGQAVVVAQGVCLGIETVQGTDALLRFVAETGAGFRPDPNGARGVLVKRPKTGQDRRMDLPAIGPETMRRAAAAGLAGVEVEAGGVLILGREATVAAAEAEGLFLSAAR
ncbi:MAG: UDP-2,3-diacylglucosamine diphosphatase LpxI [Pseudomonadota bacterium]